MDTANNTIRRISSAGDVATLAGLAGVAGNVDGSGAVARFNRPYGGSVDEANNLYVADQLAHTIRKITPAGIVTTLASFHFKDLLENQPHEGFGNRTIRRELAR